MIFQPNSITADGTPDDGGLLAMRSALRDLRVVMRKPKEHPKRAEMLGILNEARTAIDRINAPRQ